ncbi:MAG: P1 family peptidase [Acidobacteriia bacterium]|nr:P1 family peptidase [Terriglobia bacterium]
MQSSGEIAESRRPSLTDVAGILVGHFTLAERPTGCTVITSEFPITAGVDVRGGAPGTRETDLLRAENSVAGINAVFLSGGSAFGLDVGTGVVKFLEEKGLGYRVGKAIVPIVCGAILFDLNAGDPQIRPDARAGYEAARAADSAPVAEGSVGAGAGCTVGKLFGLERAMRGGLGSWAWRRADGLRVGALVAVNSLGDVRDPALGKILAGARKSDGNGFFDCMAQLRRGCRPELPIGGNTVIGVVATNATLEKASCTRIAQMAHDALARCIHPSHTLFDGDTIFALATGKHQIECNPVNVSVIGALAADVLSTAIVRGCQAAGM